MANKDFFENMTAKQGMILGLSWGIAGVALIGLVVVLAGGKLPGFKMAAATNTNQAGQPTGQQPAAQQQAQDPAGDVTKTSPITDQDHMRGNKNAQITLLEYSDFQCPFCIRHEPTLTQLLNDYKDKIRLVYRHFPLTSIHPYAQKAAEASECASEQGKFWEMHDKLFAANGELAVDALKKMAVDLKLNTSQFNNCLDSGKYASKVNQEAAEAQAAGITGTPVTFVNTELVKGAYPVDTFKQIIDGLLK